MQIFLLSNQRRMGFLLFDVHIIWPSMPPQNNAISWQRVYVQMVIPLVGKESGELGFPLKVKPLRSKLHLMALLLKRIKKQRY
jgi:hypothetical protein